MKWIRSALFATIACLNLPAIAPAQQVVAPTNEPVGSPRGEGAGNYNITDSFETGYRFHTVDGNVDKYRSDINFGNGIRLLGSNLTINSKDGHGHYFDELLLSSQGLGNDPYQFANLRVQKNHLYQYDLLWRENDYYNPALTIANGQHFLNTTRRFYDQNLTLFPQALFSVFMGYGRNTQVGPALTTIQSPDSRGDEFPLFSNIRRVQDEYRLGGEFALAGIRLSVLRGWVHFKEDTADSVNQTESGNNTSDSIVLRSFYRSQPYHGTTDIWRVNLLADRSKLYSVSGRFSYAGGHQGFVFDENTVGTDRFSAARLRQTYIFGNARRPDTYASVTLNFFPTDKITISNQTAFHNLKMDGNSTFSEINNSTLQTTLLNFQLLAIRTVTNTTDVNYRVTKWAGLYGGYEYSNRKIRSIEQTTFAGLPDTIAAEQENTVNVGLFGLRLKPVQPVTIRLDAEVGRANRPFYPISDKNYQAFNARIQYKAKSLLLTAAARTFYNTNSVAFSGYSSKSRTYSFDASWVPREWLSFDGSYSKLHLNTISGIAYFLQGELVNGNSVYISNIHAVNAGVRINIRRRVDFYAGYSRVQDLGDGRSRSSVISAGDVVVDPFLLAQTFPLSYSSPLARISVKLNTKVRWNIGYQYYHYNEEFFDRQNYRANTGYTSVTWAF